jgi:DNA-directed RNA polymerase II subunit RPB2
MNPEAQEQLLSREIEDEDSWAVINSYFKQHGLVSQQIASFNRFLENSVQDVVREH